MKGDRKSEIGVRKSEIGNRSDPHYSRLKPLIHMKNIKIFFILFVLSGCGGRENTAQEPAPGEAGNVLQFSEEQLNSFPLSFTELQEQTIYNTLKINGVIDVPPQNLVSVSSALGGYVKSTRLLPGMHFKKGEVIAILEDNQYIQLQQDYLTANTQLQKALAEFNRQKELNLSKASSDKVYQQAKADYETLLISRQSLEEKLRLINIDPARLNVNNIGRTAPLFAPFDGYVSQVFVNTGKYVSPSDVLFELVDPKDLHLNLKVFEKDLDKVNIGQPFSAYSNNNPGRKYSGKIILIGKKISEDRAVEIHAHFDKADTHLIPGLYMNAEIEVPDNNTLVLPEESIVTFEGKSYIFKALSNNRFEMTPVQTGSSGNGWVEIAGPDHLRGEKIVRKGAYTLLMALKNKAE